MTMVVVQDLIELAERCEKATGRDHILGKEILLTCGWRKTCVGNFYGPLYYWSSPDGKSYPEDRLPCPTESLDAAMTLVPEYGRVHFGPDGAEAGCSGLKCMSTWSKAATPALALCAASLRARASASLKGEG